MRKRFLRLNFCFAAVFTCTFLHISAAAQDVHVLSPVSGVWANRQSLVLDLPEGTDAFYSLNGENPLVSGIAYDGPVMLNVTGNVQLLLVITERDGKRTSSQIRYTVTPQKTPGYMEEAFAVSSESDSPSDLNADAPPVLRITAASGIDIPPERSYTIGDSGRIFSGRRLTLSKPSAFERYVPLVIYDGEIPFRCVLHTGGDAKMQNIEEADNVPLQDSQNTYGNSLSSVPFFVSRLPARPNLKGAPQFPVVNKAVELSFDNKDFLFCVTGKDGRKRYTDVFTVDVLEGDAFGFSQNIEIYCEGIKQGTVRPSFIIDKIPPSAPVFVSSEKDFYARRNVVLTVQGGEGVHYHVPKPIKSQTGFKAAELKALADVGKPEEKDFAPLTSEDVVLQTDDKTALLYTVYAYSRDAAGNRSETVRFQTVVDAVNYYAASTAKKDTGSKIEREDGSADNPFSDFSSLLAALKRSDAALVRCFVNGSFSGIPSFSVDRDTEIYGGGAARLQFEKGASLFVKDAAFSLKNCTLEQNYGAQEDNLQTRLIEAENAQIFLSGAELICRDSNNVSCIVLENSSLFAEHSGITVESSVYADALSAKSSVVNLNGIKSRIIAPTAVGLKSTQSSAVIEASLFRLFGSRLRALEFINSGFELKANRFIAEFGKMSDSSSAKKRSAQAGAAVWTNIPGQEKLSPAGAENQSAQETNTYSGFSSLYGGL